jgi:hypothetical protein
MVPTSLNSLQKILRERLRQPPLCQQRNDKRARIQIRKMRRWVEWKIAMMTTTTRCLGCYLVGRVMIWITSRRDEVHTRERQSNEQFRNFSCCSPAFATFALMFCIDSRDQKFLILYKAKQKNKIQKRTCICDYTAREE